MQLTTSYGDLAGKLIDPVYLLNKKKPSIPVPDDAQEAYEQAVSQLEEVVGFPLQKFRIEPSSEIDSLGASAHKSLEIPIKAEVLDFSEDNGYVNSIDYAIREALYTGEEDYSMRILFEEIVTHEQAHKIFVVRYQQPVNRVVNGDRAITYEAIREYGMDGEARPDILGVNEAFAFWLTDTVLGRQTLYEELANQYADKGANVPTIIKFFYNKLHDEAKESGIAYVLDNFVKIVEENFGNVEPIKLESIKPYLGKSAKCVIMGLV